MSQKIFDKNYIISFKNDNGSFTVYNSNTGKITTERSISCEIYERRYELLKPYEATHDGLLKYANDFEIFTAELRERKPCFIDYKFYYSDSMAVEGIFKIFCKDTGYDTHQEISPIEVKWMKMCNNGGLIYCKPGEYECFGYDFKMFYLRILGDKYEGFKFPCKQGYEYHFDELPEDLPFGYYKCRITSTHKDVNKIFMFSKHNVYTNYSIEFARKLADEFEFEIELLDEKINCYVYHPKDIIKSCSIFYPMFFKMSQFKKDFPKNRLVKHIASSISGHLIRYNVKSYNKKRDMTDEMWNKTCYFADEMPEEAEFAILSDNIIDEDPDMSYFEIMNLHKPMKYAVGRYKSFLMSWARNKCAYACMIDIDNVVRVQTDGIVFTKPQSFLNKLHIGEDKDKSGHMIWEHVNSWVKL